MSAAYRLGWVYRCKGKPHVPPPEGLSEREGRDFRYGWSYADVEIRKTVGAARAQVDDYFGVRL